MFSKNKNVEKILKTLKSSYVIGIGLFLGIVLSDGIGEDAIDDTILFVYFIQLGAIAAYVAIVIFKPHLTGKAAADDKRLLYSIIVLISCASLSIYYLYIYGTPILPRGMFISTFISFWEFVRAEGLYNYDKKWKTRLHNTLTIQFITLLLASCLPIGLYEGQKFLEKVLAFLWAPFTISQKVQ